MAPKFRPSKYDGQFKRVGVKGQCRLCRKKFPWTKKSGTSCLRFHLTKHHPEELEQLNNEQANRARSPDDNSIPFDDMAPVGHEVKQEITDSPEGCETIQILPKKELIDDDQLVIAMICKDRNPVTMLEGAGFRELFGKLRPDIQLKPLTYYIQNTLPILYANLVEKIRLNLTLASKVSLVFSTFKSDADTEHISLSAHWMHENMEPVQALLFYRTVRESSEISPAYIQSMLEKNYGVLHKVTGYICETPKIPKLGLLEKRSTKLPDFEGILDEIARSIYSNSQDLLRKIDHTVIDFEKDFFWKDHQEILKSVLQTSGTKNSETSPGKENQKHELTDEEMEVLKFIYNILEQIQETNDQIENRFYPTASIIIPTLRNLIFKLTDVVKNEISSLIQKIGRNILNKLETTAKNIQENMVLKTATFLDPRFKNKFFFESHRNYMMIKFKDLYDKVIKEEGQENVKSGTSASQPKIGCLEKEIESFLEEDTNSKIDPTEFWMQNQNKFPILKSIASQYLAIPASPFGIEKLYEDGQKMIPEGFSEIMRDDFVFVSSNIEVYGN